MVRNVNRRGFSVVEIMISMVILSIVVMIMSHILIATSRGQSKANSDDEGDAIALEYLAKIQNKVIEHKTQATAPTSLKEVTRDGIAFDIEWVIADGTGGLPSKATVTVKWDTQSGPQTSQIVGYVDLKNACADIPIANNTEITDLNYFTPTSHNLNVAVWPSGTGDATPTPLPTVALDKTKGFEIIKVRPVDAQYSTDTKMTYAILNSQDRFAIGSDGIIKTARALTNNDVGTHRLKLQVFDCSGANPTQNNIETIEITISTATDAPDVKDTIFAPINEKKKGQITSTTTDFDLGDGPVTAQNIPTGKTVVWEIDNDPRFGISSTGRIHLKVASKELLSYEASGGALSVPVKAKYNTPADAKWAKFTAKFPLTDLLENPTDVFLGPNNEEFISIPKNTPKGNTVCQLFIIDEDLVPNFTVLINTSANATLSSEYFGVRSSSITTGMYELYVKVDLPTTPTDDQFSISVTDEDAGHTITRSRTIKFIANTTGIDCSSVTPWVIGGYALNAEVKYNSTKFQAKRAIYSGTPMASYNPAQNTNDWQELGGCAP